MNIVLDDDVKADLDRLVEAGKRSRVINNALRREISLMRRRAASARLDRIRDATKTNRHRRTRQASSTRSIRGAHRRCHALALRHGATMVTADRAYVRKAGRAGHVTLLSEWSLSVRPRTGPAPR